MKSLPRNQRGIVVPISLLAAAISANAVQAAPAGLAPIAAPAAGGGSALTILKIMAMTKLKYGILAGILVAGVATTTVVIGLHSRVKPPPKAAALPNPNGYDYFVKAGQMLQGYSSGYRQLSEAALRAFVEQNAEALKVARQGFEYESRAADNDSQNSLNILASLKQLNSVFAAEGRLAEMENRSGDAIRSYLDDVRLGQESSRGGTLMVRLVGIAIETFGLKELQPLTNRTDAGQCKEIGLALEALDAKEPPLTETLEQEKAYAAKIYASQPMHLPGTRAIQAKMMEPAIQQAVKALQTNQLTLRQTMIAFAARAYELEKKQRPKSLGDLTPDYLKAIPQDPRTGQEMAWPP